MENSWFCKKLSDICVFSQGIQVPIGEQLTVPKEDCVRFIRIIDYTQNSSERRYIKAPGEQYRVKASDVVMIRYGDAGRVVRGYEGAIANNLFKIKCFNEEITDDYLYQYLSQPAIYSQLTNNQQKTGLPAINFKMVGNIEIRYPKSLVLQQKIAQVLDKAQQLIDQRKEQMRSCDELIASKFIKMFGDPIKNPKGWETHTLQELATQIMSGNTPKGGSKVYVNQGIMFFRSQNVWKNRLELDDVAYIDEKTHASMKKSSLKYGDILITKTGRVNTENSSLGRAALYLGEDDGANVNGHVYLIRLKSGINKRFVLRLLVSDEYRDYMRSVCVGGIDKRQLNKEHIEAFPIICPPIKEQQAFMAFEDKVNALKDGLAESLGALEDHFNALRQQAFKGELF